MRDCYGALGVIHSLWKPVPGRFKDFIAMPKLNMYQSLHTTVIGPKGEPVEIQIRTREMHRIAEDGIAAHWLYKEKKAGKDKLDDSLVWLRQLMERQQDTKDPHEFLDSVRIDLFQDEVYVFTPKGDVKALPEGATPIDFAYAVHTKVGEHTVGAKVNGKLVPLRYTLRQGDIVEIVTSPNQHPSRDWLKIVKSTRARSKINQWLKVEERARSIELGREMFDREAKKYRLNAAALLAGDEIKRVAADLGYPTMDDLLAAIGYGKASVHQLLNKLTPGGLLEPVERPRTTSTRPKPDQGVRIRGVEDLLVRFAKCCNPLPGDPIVGFITRGRGLTVHARDCLTVAKSVLDRERLIDVEWDVEEPAKRPVAHRRLHRPRPAGAALRDHRRHRRQERQHHQGRGHRHRRPARDQQLRGRGRRPLAAPGHHERHPRSSRRHQRRARPRPLAALRQVGVVRIGDKGPSASSPRRSSLRRIGIRLSRRSSAPRIWTLLANPHDADLPALRPPRFSLRSNLVLRRDTPRFSLRSNLVPEATA